MTAGLPEVALTQRLGEAARVLLGSEVATGDASALLELLVRHVKSNRDEQAIWLLWTALAGAFPTADDVIATRRVLDLADDTDGAAWLLDRCFLAATTVGSPSLEMDVVERQVVVDVDFCARHDLHTGIQRVVRETVPRWDRDHDVLLVAWTDREGAYRGLEADEAARVLRWDSAGASHGTGRTASSGRLLVPWRSVVVLPESLEAQRTRRLVGMARFSANLMTAIGYDAIPLVSPDLVHPSLPDRFAAYLTVVKHLDRVVGISRSATTEFEGFARMLASQGLSGPAVEEVQLPGEVPSWVLALAARQADPPLVLSVGSFEPRKNQLALMHAAERLWRRGLNFQVLFIGGADMGGEFDTTFRRLTRAGRPVRRKTAVTDRDLWLAYRSARVTVFPSLHEGFGLPVAESLACGTPVVTTEYGSTREIAEGGGTLLVDPRDDDALEAVLHRVLTDDTLVARLREEARVRPRRSWDDYARELWSAVTAVSTADPRPAAEAVR